MVAASGYKVPWYIAEELSISCAYSPELESALKQEFQELGEGEFEDAAEGEGILGALSGLGSVASGLGKVGSVGKQCAGGRAIAKGSVYAEAEVYAWRDSRGDRRSAKLCADHSG